MTNDNFEENSFSKTKTTTSCDNVTFFDICAIYGKTRLSLYERFCNYAALHLSNGTVEKYAGETQSYKILN